MGLAKCIYPTFDRNNGHWINVLNISKYIDDVKNKINKVEEERVQKITATSENASLVKDCIGGLKKNSNEVIQSSS